jgi:V/A-type H+-transporting ATPase subunit I
MRVDVKKYLFVGLQAERNEFFRKAQDAGIVHFIDKNLAKSKEIPKDIQAIMASIKILRGLPTMDQEETDEYALAEGLAQKILHYKEKIDLLTEEERLLWLEIERVEPFGAFSMEDIRWIEKESGRVMQFYCAREGVTHEHALPDEVIYINSENGLDYFIAWNEQPTQYEGLLEMKVDHPFVGLMRKQLDIQDDLYNFEHRLKSYAKYNAFLHRALVEKLNGYDLHAAEESVASELDGALFAIEGWVPTNKVPELRHLVEQVNLHAEEVSIGKDDAIPTYLDNEGVGKIGEDLVHIYDTPSHTDADPSMWVLLSFAFFFAFIVGDAGYGLLYLAGVIYIRYKYPELSGLKRRMLNLVTLLSVCCIIWGALTTSFFGINFSHDSPIRKISLIGWMAKEKAAYHIQHQDETYKHFIKQFPNLENVSDPSEFLSGGVVVKPNGAKSYEIFNEFSDNIMMELSLLIGVVHLSLAMLRYLPRNWSLIGWVLVLIGGYLYVPNYLGATSLIYYIFGADPVSSAKDGLYLLVGGATIAVVLAVFKHGLFGVLEIMTGVQILADTLSYLRLYALGLSGALFTATVNELAQMPILVIGVVIMVLGHSVNILLGIMGGVIHGLRLNFLEWYHYSFEGGGKRFKPLCKKTIE